MQRLVLIAVLPFVAARGAEMNESAVPTVSVRDRLRAKILESIPPLPTPTPAVEKNKEGESAIMMMPVVVAESKLMHAVTAAIEAKEQNRKDEAFSPLNGGKIGSIGPMTVGSWWTPGEGWTFLRLNKAPTLRQIEASDARLKELKELQEFGKGGAKAKP